MPDWSGGFAQMAVTSAIVAGAAFGVTPSHTAGQEAPVSTASEAHNLTNTSAPAHPVPNRQNQGHTVVAELSPWHRATVTPANAAYGLWAVRQANYHENAAGVSPAEYSHHAY